MRSTFVSLLGYVVFCLLWVEAAKAAPLAPAKPSQVVSLGATSLAAEQNAECPNNGIKFFIVADGTSNPPSFSIPSGKVFVITDLEWSGSAGGAASYLVAADLQQTDGSGVFDTLIHSPATCAAGGSPTVRCGSTEHLTTGAIAKPGLRLCLTPRLLSFTIEDATLRGFFVGDQVKSVR